MGWLGHVELSDQGTVHVWPEHEDHVTHGGEPCWCSPDSEFFANGNVMIVHRDELDRLNLIGSANV